MSRTIQLQYEQTRGQEVARFDLSLQGFKPGERVKIGLWELDVREDYAQHGDERLGTLEGTVLQPDKRNARQFLVDTAMQAPMGDEPPNIVIVTDQPKGGKGHTVNPISVGESDEGDSWEIRAILDDDKRVRSQLYYIARLERRVPDTQATYYWHAGHKVTLYNDASEDAQGSAGYFADLDKAIDEAKHFIFVADWSFHPYMRLKPSASQTIGQRLQLWGHSNSAGFVAIHTWDHTVGGATDGQNDDGEMIFKSEIVKPKNMFWRMSSRTGQDGGAGLGWSHHQKFVVMDCPCKEDKDGRRTIRVFLGGIDLTQGRFDWPAHGILPDQNTAVAPLLNVTHKGREVHDWYNCEFGAAPLTSAKDKVNAASSKFFPRQPWHDIHCQVIGPSAWDVVREFIGRWNLDPALKPNEAEGDTDDKCIDALRDFFKGTLFDKRKFVQQWEPHRGEWCAQVLRSITKDHWGTKKPVVTPPRHKQANSEFVWRIKDKKKERSIQDAYVRAISQAERFVYIETQFFIGGGASWTDKRGSVANEIPEALTRRIRLKASFKKPFHVYLILPMFPEGGPSGWLGPQPQRDFQWRTIDYMVRTLQQDPDVGRWGDYLTIGFLAQWDHLSGDPTDKGDRADAERVRNNRRYMIYVHSKMMIVDDRYLIVGSANLNERSLAGGRDSEIGVGLWPYLTTQNQCIDDTRKFRQRLFQEHFGGDPPGWENPEAQGCYKAVQEIGKHNWALLFQGKHSHAGHAKKGHFCCWPIDANEDGLGIRDQESRLILDGETAPIIGDDWYLWPTSYAGEKLDLAE